MTRTGNYKKPQAVEVVTEEKCAYGCGRTAKFKFTAGKVCCSKHYNSCPGKKKQFSDMDHSERTAKSLATRTREGITKSSQIKGGETRRNSGHYDRLADKMREHWGDHPWQNNLQCPLLPYKDTKLLFQGSYELKFLEALEEQHGTDWITENVRRGPTVWYDDPNGKERLYISDFIIGNTIYEIKSGWTWDHKGADPLLEELNKAKLTRCVELNYNVILVLNGEEIQWQ